MKDWKRHEKAKSLVDQGLTMKAVGTIIGVSGSRISAMLNELAARERRLAFEADNPKPAPWFEGLKKRTAWALERSGLNSREACMALAADDLTMWRGSVALPGYEEDKDSWACSNKRLKLSIVNEVRAWLGVAPYVPPARRAASEDDLERARRLLEQHGWRVEPPVGK